MGFDHGKKRGEVIRSLPVKEESLVNPVLMRVSTVARRRFMEPIRESYGPKEIKAFPRPVNALSALPFVPAFI